MKVQTSELTGNALDWTVAQIESEQVYLPHLDRICADVGEPEFYHPSTNWSQGGPIIEREKLAIAPYQDGGWICTSPTDRWHGNKSGPTPLIAAMRCYVASKLGGTVDIPDELNP